MGLPTEQLNGGPEWGSAKRVEELFGLTKGTLYKLADQGAIKWSLIKTRPGARKGIRLFYLPSIRALIHEHVNS